MRTDDGSNHSPRNFHSAGSKDLERRRKVLVSIWTPALDYNGHTVLVLDQLYIVEGCESVRTVDHCPETSCSTVRKVPSSLKLFYTFEDTVNVKLAKGSLREY